MSCGNLVPFSKPKSLVFDKHGLDDDMVCSWNNCVCQRLYELESKFSGLEHRVKTLGQAISTRRIDPIRLYIFITP